MVHMMHQVVCGSSRRRVLVGLLCAMTKATGKDKDMAVKGQIAEAMGAAEYRAFRLSRAPAHPDQRRNYMPLRQPRTHATCSRRCTHV